MLKIQLHISIKLNSHNTLFEMGRSRSYDLIVIGSGPAGEKAAVKAAYFGKKVALIEKSKDSGGAGVQTGTLPSKTLKETALYFSRVYEKHIFETDDIKPLHKTKHEQFTYRRDVARNDMQDEVDKNLLRHNVDVYRGFASFVDEHNIKISGSEELFISGKNILIATGSYPVNPSDIPFDGKRIHDSDTILRISRFPKSLCVIGAGVIGCEYATIYAAMGVKVYLINNRDKILPFLDSEIADALVTQMKKQGIEILFNTSIVNYHLPAKKSGNIKLTLKNGDVLKTDMVLYAAGRSGNISGMNCGNAGIITGDRETVIVDENYRTNVPHIYAVGDVIGFPALASTSMDQGRVAITNMYHTNDFDSVHKVFPYGIYTVPEVSMVGMTEQDAVSRGIKYCTGISKVCDIARGKILGSPDDGFLKLVFENDTKIILGVHIIGRIASELIHYGMTLVQDKKTLDNVIATVFNYPTFHDLYKYAAYDGLGNISGKNIKNPRHP
ncbi:MAG TPA: Si-specific NAD(P)(+) transhydrogenase [Ignavibacteria bacterium]|nr:Si-specific NAD(P)(+) transhydrogenase [Ignavibacteria bacterium]